MPKFSKEQISKMVHDSIERSWYAFYFRSSSSNPDHKRWIRYFQSENKPKAAYYSCDIKGEWESPIDEMAGPGVLLMEKKLQGSVCFSGHPTEKSIFYIHSHFSEETLRHKVGSIIRVNKDVMNFIHHTIDKPKDIQIRFTLEDTPELFDHLTKFLNTDEPMDMQFVIEDFTIEQ
jgi:hypothetical protein